MRINKLSVQGFGPYKTAQHVDFDAFADDGIFLMGGKTGAGKSSILDAICFALYDSVPRYDGTKARLRSDHAGPEDASLVTLEFTAGDTRYRVERAPEFERQKARGTGTTKQKATAELFELRGTEWHGIEAQPREVGPRIAELVGLNKDQFLQVILLAQNRFQQFLLAKSEARQEVLRSLFGTRRFQDYEATLTEQRKQLDAELGSRRATLKQMVEQAGTVARALGLTEQAAAVPESRTAEALTPWLAGLTDAARQLVLQALDAAETADARFAAADAAHDSRVALRAAQQRRAAAEARLAELRAAIETIDAERAALAAAARAEVALGAVTTAARARTALQAAEGARERALSAFVALPTTEGNGGSPAELALLIETSTQEQGALNETLALETSLPALHDAVEQHARQHAAAESALAEVVERSTALPALIAADTARLAELRLTAARLDPESAERDRLAATLAHAQRVVTMQPELAAAREAEFNAGLKSTAASARLDRLRARRLNGHAAELALELRDGEPCAVCGGREHPHPAEVSTDAVGAEDIAAAEAELAECRAVAETAREAAHQIDSELAAETALAGTLPARLLEAKILRAEESIASAAAAAAESDELAVRLGEHTTELRELAAAVAACREALTLAVTAHTAARTRIEEGEQRVAEQRAGYPTIAARGEALARTLAAAHTLADAQGAVAVAGTAAAGANAELGERLEQQGFDSADAVSAAHLDAEQRAALERRLRAHDDAIAATSAILAEPELAGLPVEEVALWESEAALQLARTERDEALTRRATLGAHAASLRELVGTVEAELAASADLIARHEIVARLAATVKGDAPNERRMRLESFVLAAELEEIVAAANARLHQMSGGRYLLEHDDSIGYRGTQSGLGLAILDSHTGAQRPTHSLSGGETFLASLALALGLAEVVTGRAGGITLDTLFIDEGFGSLDAETLEIAMSTLDGLRTGGRTIGLISHVEAMKEQIHASLQVSVSEQGWSTISQSA
ncbi:AAA family ATPase [Microterricola viridarii]|uniref:Nuclease SbcCD subunit C n=1 Tax=Microterricola viridarii TaxID=412690 RepID=A0A0Y0MBQ0_9MICO|nr:SMC family ATPase [Microterricola viridarii]AMB57526.1 hypothetical protein AWU67_00125 [Microterricola viridarii]